MYTLSTTTSPFLEDGITVNINYEANLQCHHHDMHSDLNQTEREAELKEELSTIVDTENRVGK